MKIKFDHFALCYPNPTEVTVDFFAETEFERQYLNALMKHTKDFTFCWRHPCGEKAESAIQLKCTNVEPETKQTTVRG